MRHGRKIERGWTLARAGARSRRRKRQLLGHAAQGRRQAGPEARAHVGLSGRPAARGRRHKRQRDVDSRQGPGRVLVDQRHDLEPGRACRLRRLGMRCRCRRLERREHDRGLRRTREPCCRPGPDARQRRAGPYRPGLFQLSTCGAHDRIRSGARHGPGRRSQRRDRPASVSTATISAAANANPRRAPISPRRANARM